MKKTIIVILVCLFIAVGLSAARTRGYTTNDAIAGTVISEQQSHEIASSGAKAGYVLIPTPYNTFPPVVPLECPVEGNPICCSYLAVGSGVNTIFIDKGEHCHGYAHIGGVWGVLAGFPEFTWLDVDFDAEGGVVEIILYAPNTPVELSSFSASLTAQSFVKLTWVTETETGLSGYRVYRGETNDVANAIIVSSLISPTNTSQTSTYTHIDSEVTPETTYNYWLEAVDTDGTTNFYGPTSVYVTTPTDAVPCFNSKLGNAYPNPFKVTSGTQIAYEVKTGETGTITIYNVKGQIVMTFPVSETTQSKTFTWNGRDSKGAACSNGIYFYKLSTPTSNITRKMLIVE